VKVGDLVHYDKGSDWGYRNTGPGVVVGFDKDDDPIVYFAFKQSSDAYFKADIEVINENR
jgi:hypothetical protein